jgi:hypothetical protein
MLGAGGPERLGGFGPREVGIVPEYVQRGRDVDRHVHAPHGDTEDVLAILLGLGSEVLPAPRLEASLDRHAIVDDNDEMSAEIGGVPRLKAVEFENAVFHREVQGPIGLVHLFDAARAGQVVEVGQNVLRHPPVHHLSLRERREHGKFHELVLALADEAADGKAEAAESVGLDVQVDFHPTAVSGDSCDGGGQSGDEGRAIESRSHGWLLVWVIGRRLRARPGSHNRFDTSHKKRHGSPTSCR